MSYRKLPDPRALRCLSKLGLTRSGSGPRSRGKAAHTLPKKWRVLAGLAYAATLLVVSCSRPVETPPSVVIEHEVSPDPPRVGPAVIAFKLSDATGKPLFGAHVVIEANMSHAGMSPQFTNAKEAESGHYSAQFAFPMAGDWAILLHITLPNEKKLEGQIDVRGVRAN